MPRSEDVPRSEPRSGQTRICDESLTLRPYVDERPHYRSRLRDADIDEVSDADLRGRADGSANGRQVDPLKLGRLPWTGMGCSDQMHEDIAVSERTRDRVDIQSVANYRLCAGDDSGQGQLPH